MGRVRLVVTRPHRNRPSPPLTVSCHYAKALKRVRVFCVSAATAIETPAVAWSRYCFIKSKMRLNTKVSLSLLLLSVAVVLSVLVAAVLVVLLVLAVLLVLWVFWS